MHAPAAIQDLQTRLKYHPGFEPALQQLPKPSLETRLG